MEKTIEPLAIAIEERLYPVLTLPGRPRAILDRTAAEIYNTETKYVNRAVLRNQEKFPQDFYFQLTIEETRSLNEVPFWNLDWTTRELNDLTTKKILDKKGRSTFYIAIEA